MELQIVAPKHTSSGDYKLAQRIMEKIKNEKLLLWTWKHYVKN